MNHPACRDADPDTFFPVAYAWDLDVAENARRAVAAKLICAGCPLLAACRERALHDGDPIAILGGLLPEERSAAREAQRVLATA